MASAELLAYHTAKERGVHATFLKFADERGDLQPEQLVVLMEALGLIERMVRAERYHVQDCGEPHTTHTTHTHPIHPRPIHFQRWKPFGGHRHRASPAQKSKVVPFTTEMMMRYDKNKDGVLSFDEFRGFYNAAVEDAKGRRPVAELRSLSPTKLSVVNQESPTKAKKRWALAKAQAASRFYEEKQDAVARAAATASLTQRRNSTKSLTSAQALKTAGS